MNSKSCEMFNNSMASAAKITKSVNRNENNERVAL